MYSKMAKGVIYRLDIRHLYPILHARFASAIVDGLSLNDIVGYMVIMTVSDFQHFELEEELTNVILPNMPNLEPIPMYEYCCNKAHYYAEEIRTVYPYFKQLMDTYVPLDVQVNYIFSDVGINPRFVDIRFCEANLL